jgi:hypothetical protein
MLIRLFAILFLAASFWGQPLPRAPKPHLSDITPKPGFFNEPAIAVNPRDPQQLVVAWQVNASIAYSNNGGQNWTVAEGTAAKDYRVSGDVSVAYDAAGHALLCYIAFDRLGTTNYWAHGATRNGIFVRRSLDGGKTWEPDASTVIAHDSTPDIPFEDKPWIVTDVSGKHAGNIYLGWTQFTLAASDLLFARSTDGGKTWSKPIKLNAAPGLPRDDNGALEGFHGVVGPDGTLYVIWDARDGIMMAVSHDGGASFSKERRIIPVGPGYFGITGVARSNGFPQIGLDSRPNGGSAPDGGAGANLYVSWSDYSNGDVDVFVSSSSDHGFTWTAPVRANTDPIHNGADQFFQWMAVDPQNGTVNLIFYDRRPDNQRAAVTLARSTDSFQPEGDFLGDYTAITAFGNKVWAAWAHQTSEETKLTGTRKTRTVLRVGSADFN